MHTAYFNRNYLRRLAKKTSQLIFLCTLILLSLASLGAFLGRTHWLLDLLTHFRLHLTLVFLILAIGLSLAKRPVWASWATLGLLLNLTTLVPYFFRPTVIATPIQAPHQARALFNNINYHTRDLTPLLATIDAEQPTFLGLAELTEANFQVIAEQLKTHYPYQTYTPGRGMMGLALFSQLPFAGEPQVFNWAGNDFPSLLVKLQAADQATLTVALIHPPPPLTAELSEIRNTIFANLAEYSRRLASPLLIMGDFNSTSWSPYFRDLLKTGALADSRQSQGLQTSWPSHLPAPLRITIDHFLFNQNLQIINRRLLPNVGSDHLPIGLDFAW